MRPTIIITALLLGGCATTMYAGVGYDVGSNNIQGVFDTDTSKIVFDQDAWDNPIGIVGLRYPLGEHFEVDYRHVSSLGTGHDIVNSDALSVIMKIGGSRRGWGLDKR